VTADAPVTISLSELRREVDILAPSEVDRWIRDAESPPDAVRTHLSRLNAVCGDTGGGLGLGMGWHVVIGGDTGHGKSLLALNLCRDAVRDGVPVGFMSLEMSIRQLETRFYAIVTNQPVVELEPGPRFRRSSADVVRTLVLENRNRMTLPFFVHEAGFSEIDTVIEVMEGWRDEGCRLFVIDYLQLCSAGDADSMTAELVKISSTVRKWAKDHKVLVLALSQYSYGASKNRQVPPTIHSLYGSARLGQDADLCLLLDHSRYERTEHFYQRGGHERRYSMAKTYLVIAKNRHGDGGDIPIEWDYRTLTSREGLPDEEHEWPGSE
jgi:replicative DNA helicase